MRYLASSAINFSIWSSDPQLIGTNVFVRAPPKATVARLLQYIHCQLHQRGVNSLGGPQEYELFYRAGPLDLALSLQDIEPQYSGVVRLRLEKRASNSGPAINLEYDGESELTLTKVEFQMNILSMEKIMSHLESNVSLSCSLSKLKRTAIHILNDYENSNPKNICSVKNHTVEDLAGFDIVGRLHPMFLALDDAHNDLRLCDLLGFDFAPDKSSYCSVMFKVRHDQGFEDGIRIEFVSDSKLSINHMMVTPETTVEQVKEFICSVYGHALRLTPLDVKLIYKGQLLHDKNYAGRSSKVLEYISESRGAKVHVQINQEYTEPGPGFWSELFNSPDRFSFMNGRSSSSEAPSISQDTAAIPEPAMLQRENNLSQRSEQHIDCDHQFVTDSGSAIERTGLKYEKILVSGQEFFVPTHKFERTQHYIEVMGHQIAVSIDDYVIAQGSMILSPHVIRQIESITGRQIMKFDLKPSTPMPTPTVQDHTINNVVLEENQRITRIKLWIETIMKTIYLMLRNSVLLFIIFLQVANFVPTYYTLIGIVFILIRALWCTTEIWDLWRELLSHGQVERLTTGEIASLERTLDNHLTKRFFSRFAGSLAVRDALMVRLQNDATLRSALATEYRLDGAESLNIFVPQLLESCTGTQFDEVPITSLKLLFDPLITEVASQLHDISGLSDAALEFLTQLRRHAYQISNLPWHRNAMRWFRIHRPWHFVIDFYNGGLMRHLVTDPRRDNIVVATLKHILLFFFLFWPKFQVQFEDIIAERATEQSSASLEQNDLPQVVEEVLPQPAGEIATGAEIRPN